MEAEITLSYQTEREARSVARAVSPDNLEAPAGLSIKTVREGKRVITHLQCNLSLGTLIATLDDFLSCVSVAERALSAAKGTKA
ncbi:hypothetical protein GWN63_03480 [Candidatus Bathyarchaeota archaeon]|nr:hypothetical protein [Candidatus Bathyarchaeota archaeon]NIU81291.1 hypothetical protein [Candidatus Bathyarchaeota archaeon]NIV67926.1 hypothetical protein [Candidatus Bathyarchaeota archaeon]NIW16367.1 hypothetical protein [Candidatus Bathyarchaeota archaeon]